MYVIRYLWYDIVLCAYHLINRLSSFVLHGKILFSCIYPDIPIFSLKSRVFRCTYFVQNLTPCLGKLSSGVIKCVFVGYSSIQKGISVMIRCLESIFFLLMLHSLSLHYTSHHPISLFISYNKLNTLFLQFALLFLYPGHFRKRY